jgi:hypothetical protein
MNRILRIAAIPLIILLFTAEQCGEARETTRQEYLLNSRKNEIRSNFESGFLTESSLYEYETAAKQKLKDIADYLQILTDTTAQLPIREKAGEMISGNFISKSSRITLRAKPGGNPTEMIIDSLIRSGLQNSLIFSRFTFDSLKIEQPFHRENEEYYSAALSFIQKFENLQSNALAQTCPTGHLEVCIIKKIKVFGSDSLLVWVMQFRNIQ